MQNNYQKKIASFYKTENRMPTYTEMMKLFGFRSKNAVSKVVTKLMDAGLVAKDHLGRLIPQDNFSDVPMLGYVTAGFPADVERELVDHVNLDDMLVGKREITYLLTVDGDSMTGEYINDGDMVLVEKTEQASDGDIVIAQIDGEFTMKYLRDKGGQRWLEPANPKYKPLYPNYELKVIAKLKAVIRKY